MLSSAPAIQFVNRRSWRELWLTKKNARIQRAPARHNQAESTVAPRAKALARLSSWTVTADTTVVREISNENPFLKKGTKGATTAGIYQEPS
jgi:hypothetical protein